MSDNEEQESARPADAPSDDDPETHAEVSAEQESPEPDAETQSEREDAPEVEPETLLERLREADEDLADTIEERVLALAEERDDLEARLGERNEEVEALESEIEDLQTRVKRTQADFQNYKKRAKKRQDQLEERATEDLVTRLVDVRDNLVRALETDHDDVESIREGVEMTLREFDHVLDAENVATVDPEPGTEVDPQRHEVMMRVESDQPADTVAEVYRAGYEMAGKVIRTAQITVSEGSGDEAEHGDGEE